VTVNLAPADVKKEGGHFDLAIALGIVASGGQLDPASLRQVAAVGELALDGSLRATPGILPIVMAARARKPSAILVPAANATEASVVRGIPVVPVASLRQAVEHL
ncbi:MAG TPA: ATP-dependent protease, partial [Candidatus Omnitrophica bacterium]|nr:ATP-dependent protease [Candidatus Omnitrophota bacterium]